MRFRDEWRLTSAVGHKLRGSPLRVIYSGGKIGHFEGGRDLRNWTLNNILLTAKGNFAAATGVIAGINGEEGVFVLPMRPPVTVKYGLKTGRYLHYAELDTAIAAVTLRAAHAAS